MRRLAVLLVGLALLASSCAAPESYAIECAQVAVGEQVIITGAPVKTSSPWGFILDTVRWTADNGVTITDWQLGGDLDNDALQAVVGGVEAGSSSIHVEYAQLNRDGVGAVRSVTEECEINVVELPDFDLNGDWRITRRIVSETECPGGPTDGDVDIDITQDSSGNLIVEGINAGYEAWPGSIDQSDVTFGGLRDEVTEIGGGTTDATFALTATSRSRMNGEETWSWSDGITSCAAVSDLTVRKR